MPLNDPASDEAEERLVNPAIVTLAQARGDWDLNGLRYVVIAYGKFSQVVAPLPEGGGYQLGLESSHGNQYGRNMKSINNRFTGSGWGAAYVTANGVGYKWAVWQDNYLLDANAPDAKGKPAGTP